MKAAIRINSLTLNGAGQRSLAAMEAHGKREDQSSQRRRVRNVAPLVHGTLDLRAAFAAHVADCRMNAGLKKPVMHAIVQFPPVLGKCQANCEIMLRLAVRFINQTHGGDAVFAARLDQDEEGLATVDVFYAPRYLKQGKRRSEMWISTTKHGKELAEKHRGEIIRRNKGRFSTAPRHIGIAMQAELYDFLGKSGLQLEARTEKEGYSPDRLEPEVGKARRDARAEKEAAKQLMEKARQAEVRAAERQAMLDEQEVERQALLLEARLAADEAKRERERAEVSRQEAVKLVLEARAEKARIAQVVERARVAAAKEAAETTVGMMVASLTGTKIADTPVKRQIWPVIRPILARFATWWKGYRGRVEALPADRIAELIGEPPGVEEVALTTAPETTGPDVP